MKNKKSIGIIGGMGPLATVDLFEKIIVNTKACCDCEHIHIYIDSNPQIPDRTNAIIGKGQSPLPFLLESAFKLINLGADFLIIPCNTSHYYFEELKRNCGVPLINMLEETMVYLKHNNIKEAVLFATNGTILTNIYEKYAKQYNIRLFKPNKKQQSIIMDLIYKGVKSGDDCFDCDGIQKVIDFYCKEKQLQIILGCTELPIAIKKYNLKGKFIDPTLILAKKAIEYAGYERI